MIKATFFIECGLPRDADGVNLKFIRHLRFVPPVGLYIAVVDGDDFRQIEQVYWSDADAFHIFLKFQPNAKIKWMKSLGWQSAD